MSLTPQTLQITAALVNDWTRFDRFKPNVLNALRAVLLSLSSFTVLISCLFWPGRYYWKGEIQDASEILMVSLPRQFFVTQRVC